MFLFTVCYVFCYSLFVSLPGASQTSSNSVTGCRSVHPTRGVLLHCLHPQAAAQQALHPPHHHLRFVINISLKNAILLSWKFSFVGNETVLKIHLKQAVDVKTCIYQSVF